MNIYRGTSRRQVGGGLFSTISRGAKPIILSLLAKLRPHVFNATKAVGKRAAKAALNVGTDLASNFVSGRLNKRKAEDIFKSEINDIKTDANEVIDNYKQKLAQTGKGKRRKLNKKTMKKRTNNINKGKKPKRLSRKKRIGKSKRVVNNKKGRKTKKVGRSKRKQYKQKKIFNNDIFGK